MRPLSQGWLCQKGSSIIHLWALFFCGNVKPKENKIGLTCKVLFNDDPYIIRYWLRSSYEWVTQNDVLWEWQLQQVFGLQHLRIQIFIIFRLKIFDLLQNTTLCIKQFIIIDAHGGWGVRREGVRLNIGPPGEFQKTG